MLDFADRYLSIRHRGSWLVTALNLVAVAAFIFSGLPELLERALSALGGDEPLRPYALVPLYCGILFAAHALINFPFEFWYGYALDRQFGLARDGARFWVRAWLIGVIQNGVMFAIGSCLIVTTQVLIPRAWVPALGVILLTLFLLTRLIEADLLPVGLFQFDRADRLALAIESNQSLPPVFVFGHIDQRDALIIGMGLGPRRALLISRPAAARHGPMSVSEALHSSRSWRIVVTTLIVWAVAMVIHLDPWRLVSQRTIGTPQCIPRMALLVAAWTVAMRGIDLMIRRLGRHRLKSHRRGPNLLSGYEAGNAMSLFCRLTMWLPNPVCRCGMERLGRPAAWFVPTLDQ